MRNALPLFAILAVALLVPPAIPAADYEIIELGPGETKDVYFQINLSGNVYLRIVAEPGGQACADLWWIKWPLGNIEKLGRHCHTANLKIPGWTSAAISSKLRAGGATHRLKIVASATEEVANKVTIKF